MWSHFIMEVYWSEQNFTSCIFVRKDVKKDAALCLELWVVAC